MCWVVDHWDDVLSDWSAIHHVEFDRIETMTAREFWPRTVRLVHYQGAVRDVAMSAHAKRSTTETPEQPTTQAEPAMLVDPTPDQIRALREAARRKRYPAEKFGEMKYVTESDIVREAGRNA